jgi:hypothetical protein
MKKIIFRIFINAAIPALILAVLHSIAPPIAVFMMGVIILIGFIYFLSSVRFAVRRQWMKAAEHAILPALIAIVLVVPGSYKATIGRASNIIKLTIDPQVHFYRDISKAQAISYWNESHGEYTTLILRLDNVAELAKLQQDDPLRQCIGHTQHIIGRYFRCDY